MGESDIILIREPAALEQRALAAEAEAERLAQAADGNAAVALACTRRAERAETALMAISTDCAQDALEDPIGHAEREAAGFYRIGRGAMNALRAALSSPGDDTKETP